jgi:hypothetical protein
MADRLRLPDPDLQALAGGTVIVAFAERHSVGLNDELDLIPAGPRLDTELSEQGIVLNALGPPDRELVGLVVGLQPAASLAGPAGADHHVLAEAPEGDVLILRVFSPEGPVLSDEAFGRQRAAIEAMFR